MSPPWKPEIVVDRALVLRRVARDFPELRNTEPVHAGAGFDIDVWRFGEIALRFPRRASAAELLDGERRALSWLAGRLPTAIPDVLGWSPVGDADYPLPVLAVRWVDGEPSDGPDRVDGTVGAELGAVLRALHDLDPPALADRTSKGDLDRRSERTVPKVDALAPLLDAETRERVRQELASPVPPPGPPVVAHTDVYPRHVLLRDGRLSGIIDWGDAGLSDAAPDLAIAFTLLDDPAPFFAAYGAVSDAVLARARRMALIYGVVLGAWGLDIGDPRFVRVARRVLGAAGGLSASLSGR